MLLRNKPSRKDSEFRQSLRKKENLINKQYKGQEYKQRLLQKE